MVKGSKKTVLHYTGYAQDGGGIHAVLRNLQKTDLFRTILGVSRGFVSKGPVHERIWFGPVVHGEQVSLKNLGCALLAACRIRRWLRRGSHRIFHGHSRAGLLVALWLWILGERRVFVTVHVFGRQRWFYRASKRILGAHQRWINPAMAAYYGGLETAWEECLTDCVPEQEFRPRERRTVLPFVFGCVGSLVPVKNWELVLRALAFIPPEVPLRVVHAGGCQDSAVSRKYAEKLHQLGREPDVRERFEWRGEIASMQDFYGSLDCLLVASRWEASSVAVLEALAVDVPVLASDKSGTCSLVSFCSGGWSFPADNAEALAGRMQDLVTGDEISKWRKNEAALAGFTVVAVASAHAALYRRLA